MGFAALGLLGAVRPAMAQGPLPPLVRMVLPVLMPNHVVGSDGQVPSFDTLLGGPLSQPPASRPTRSSAGLPVVIDTAPRLTAEQQREAAAAIRAQWVRDSTARAALRWRADSIATHSQAALDRMRFVSDSVQRSAAVDAALTSAQRDVATAEARRVIAIQAEHARTRLIAAQSLRDSLDRAYERAHEGLQRRLEDIVGAEQARFARDRRDLAFAISEAQREVEALAKSPVMGSTGHPLEIERPGLVRRSALHEHEVARLWELLTERPVTRGLDGSLEVSLKEAFGPDSPDLTAFAAGRLEAMATSVVRARAGRPVLLEVVAGTDPLRDPIYGRRLARARANAAATLVSSLFPAAGPARLVVRTGSGPSGLMQRELVVRLVCLSPGHC